MRKKIAVALIGVLCMAGCNKQADFDDRCVKEAREQTLRLCPRKMAEGIILDSITYKKDGRVFEYCYTMNDSLYSQQLINQAKDKLREGLKKEILNSIELKKYKENDVVFRYVYMGKFTKKPVLEFVFAPKEYKVKK